MRTAALTFVLRLATATILGYLGWTSDAAAEERFVEGPYVDRLVPGGATVHVRLRSAAPVYVRFEFPGGTLERHTDAGNQHAILVSGLPDDALVRYVVTGGGARAEGRFRTAPQAFRPHTFLTLGDCRDGDPEHARNLAGVAYEPDFFVHLGDMVPMGRSQAEWTNFLRIAGPMLARTALVPVLGNHELIGENGRAMFHERFAMPLAPAAYYVFDFAGTRVLVLDSNAALDEGSAQHRFAQRELVRAVTDPPKRLFVAIHHGPLSSGRHGGLEVMHDSGLVRLMREARVDLVLSGHDHIYERGEYEGLAYLVTGGCGSPLYPANSRERYQRRFEAVHHTTRVDVTQNGVSFEATRLDGTLIERCTREGHGAFHCALPAATSARPPAREDESGVGSDEDGAESAAVPYGKVAVVVALLLAGIAFLVFRRGDE